MVQCLSLLQLNQNQLSEIMNVRSLKVQSDNAGQLFFEIPNDLLDRLGWAEGDDIEFIEKDDGLLLRKVKYESVELEFSKESLLEYMVFAHEQNITFNELCQNAIKNKIEEIN